MINPRRSGSSAAWWLLGCGVLCALAAGGVHVHAQLRGPMGPLVDTKLKDFFLPGTQPDLTGDVLDPIFAPSNCTGCHGGFGDFGIDLDAEPARNWRGSMMAQSMRDPVFQAAMTIANQDAGFAGDLCIRCHTPAGWLEGRSVPTDGSLLEGADFDGVSCNFCHRLVDPIPAPGNPTEDAMVLADLATAGHLPTEYGNAGYVLDPTDSRRGPFDDVPFNPHGAEIIPSPFHSSSNLCASCHDVSNPVFERQPDGTYALGDLDKKHMTLNKADMFPVERTFSEWAQSAFAAGGVQMNGRFGGNHPTGVMESCQDCHMPDVQGKGCILNGFPERPNIPQHAFNGGNTWVLSAVHSLYPDTETKLTDSIVADANARVAELLASASDMELSRVGSDLRVRIINYSGHKLPTGYPEGRRMWLNVKFFDLMDLMIGEHGAYDFGTAALTTGDTKVYEAKLGVDAAVSMATGVPEGESFHFAINNVILKDNRIPPMGFTNAGFESVQAAPVAATYVDGQFWDDTDYPIPAGARRAEVTLYYQTTSREYIEFLRDANTTDSTGMIAYNAWVAQGKSAPAVMDQGDFQINPADFNGDGVVGSIDLATLIGSWGPCPPAPAPCPADLDGDGAVGAADLATLIGLWG